MSTLFSLFQYQRQLQAQLARPPVSHTPSQAKPVSKEQHAGDRQVSMKLQVKTKDTVEEVGEQAEKEKNTEDNGDVEMKEGGLKSDQGSNNWTEVEEHLQE